MSGQFHLYGTKCRKIRCNIELAPRVIIMTTPNASTQKLTPLLFLERSAAVYPAPRRLYLQRRRHILRAVLRTGAPSGRRIAQCGCRPRRSCRVPAAQPALHAGSQFWTHGHWRRAGGAEHTTLAPRDRLHPQPLRLQGAGVRLRARRHGAPVTRRLSGRRDLRSGTRHRAPGERHSRSRVRAVAGGC